LELPFGSKNRQVIQNVARKFPLQVKREFEQALTGIKSTEPGITGISPFAASTLEGRAPKQDQQKTHLSAARSLEDDSYRKNLP
jgi:hypothetical protein